MNRTLAIQTYNGFNVTPNYYSTGGVDGSLARYLGAAPSNVGSSGIVGAQYWGQLLSCQQALYGCWGSFGGQSGSCVDSHQSLAQGCPVGVASRFGNAASYAARCGAFGGFPGYTGSQGYRIDPGSYGYGPSYGSGPSVGYGSGAGYNFGASSSYGYGPSYGTGSNYGSSYGYGSGFNYGSAPGSSGLPWANSMSQDYSSLSSMGFPPMRSSFGWNDFNYSMYDNNKSPFGVVPSGYASYAMTSPFASFGTSSTLALLGGALSLLF